MKTISFIIFSLLSVTAFSQSLTSIQYSIGFGAGDAHDYIKDPSFRGITVDYRKLVKPNLGIGFEIGWNAFYEGQSGETYTRGNLTYSGNQYRYQSQFPLLFAADYYLKPGEKMNPFAGFGIGTMYSRRNTDMSVYSLKQDAWNFAIRPEVGLLYEATPQLNFMVSGKYYHGFKAGDLPTQAYFTLNFGIVFKQ